MKQKKTFTTLGKSLTLILTELISLVLQLKTCWNFWTDKNISKIPGKSVIVSYLGMSHP